MKNLVFLLILTLCVTAYSQAIAVINEDHSLDIYNYQGGDWVKYPVLTVTDAYRCSFDENGMLWVVGDGTFYRVDYFGYTDMLSPIPGGNPCDISAHGEVVINPSSRNVCYYVPEQDKWAALPMSGLGQAIEFFHDEDREIYLTHDAAQIGDTHVSSYNWDFDFYQYTYPMDLFGIFDMTVQPNGNPIAMAFAHDGISWYMALWTWNGTYWEVPGESMRWYCAVDCTPGGNIAGVYSVFSSGDTWAEWNNTDVVYLSPAVRDVAAYDYSITP